MAPSLGPANPQWSLIKKNVVCGVSSLLAQSVGLISEASEKFYGMFGGCWGLLAGSSRSVLNTTHGRANTLLASEGG